MSTLCIYGCGNFTNEPDDICARCKGFSSIKKIKTSPPLTEGPSMSKTEGEKGESGMWKKKPCSTPGCGRATQKEGLCYKCFKEKYGVAPYPGQDHQKKSQGIAKKPVPINKQCSVEGCEKYAVKNRMCISHFKESLAGKSQLSAGALPVKKITKKSSGDNIGMTAGKISKPESKNVIPLLDRGIQDKDNGKTLCLGQLLYASELLDGQIESALDSGIIDTNILINIRKRMGEVLRASLPLDNSPLERGAGVCNP